MRSHLPRLRLFSAALLHGGPIVLSLSLPACSGTSSGTLLVNWTIASSSDASLCNKNFGWVVVQLADSSGRHYSSSNGPCSSFSTSFGGVPSDTYTVTAYMYNGNTDATISKASPQSVNVPTGTTVTVSIDFPLATAN